VKGRVVFLEGLFVMKRGTWGRLGPEEFRSLESKVSFFQKKECKLENWGGRMKGQSFREVCIWGRGMFRK